ncbi:Uncharacterised protein [Vibrio cholerae]|uniref:Uncharacterized protein n=1 Tax=Vibrio cholerae TaxID=666 RepID=A0A655RRT4_VIBCL|nr:Uncharacterised protein [Vibrio cholerae]CSC34240.1 Uncharacterised protein [Vibrio cholerae]CSC71491.1 Uncharacterised protein [Vibrio cholerae]
MFASQLFGEGEFKFAVAFKTKPLGKFDYARLAHIGPRGQILAGHCCRLRRIGENPITNLAATLGKLGATADDAL